MTVSPYIRFGHIFNEQWGIHGAVVLFVTVKVAGCLRRNRDG